MKQSLPRFFTDVGGSLPAVGDRIRGVIAIKRATATEDEVHIGLHDSSGASVWRRLLTKTYGDTLYALTGHTHAATGLTVGEGGNELYQDVNTLDFDASDFTLSESPADEVNISLNYGTSAGTPAEGNHTHAADVTLQTFTGMAHSGADLASRVDNSSTTIFANVISTAFTLPTGTWTCTVMVSGNFFAAGAVSAEIQLVIDGTTFANGNTSALTTTTYERVELTGQKTGVAAGSRTISYQFRSNDGTEIRSSNGSILLIAKRTA